MITPFCLAGASMGSAVVTIFSTMYPEYISMLCLMTPPRMFILFSLIIEDFNFVNSL